MLLFCFEKNKTGRCSKKITLRVFIRVRKKQTMKIINCTPHSVGIFNHHTKSVDRIESTSFIRLGEPLDQKTIETDRYEYRAAPERGKLEIDKSVDMTEPCEIIVSEIVGRYIAENPDTIPAHVRVVGPDWARDRMMRNEFGQPDYTRSFVIYRERQDGNPPKTKN
jgi:hypothetical protein